MMESDLPTRTKLARHPATKGESSITTPRTH